MDDSGTSDYLEEWLANNDQTTIRVHIDLLFRAIGCNFSYVYATNYLIRLMNRLDNTSIKLSDDRYLKKMREILMIQDMSIFDSVVVSSKIEIKVGIDRQSLEQKQYQRTIESAGGIYLIARSFDEFARWFDQHIKQLAHGN